MEENLRYRPFGRHEQSLMIHIATTLPQTPEVMASLDEHHNVGERCAVVIEFLPDGEVGEFYHATDDIVRERFPFKQVQQALDEYDPEDSICVVVVRNGRDVTALATGKGVE